jgi:peptide/nickel transport system substrate-binding protein
VGELWSNWMNAIGIQVELEAYDQDQLFEVIVNGTYDTFYWGWVPFVDPDPMLSYFTEAELGNWNDANWFDPRFDELYLEQNQEVDPDRRLEIVHEMVRILYDEAVYPVLWYAPDLQAYRTDGFEGFVQQPEGVGPVIFSQSSPSYALLRPIGADAPEATGEETEEPTSDESTGDTGDDATGEDTSDNTSGSDDAGTTDDADDAGDAGDEAAEDDDGGNGTTIAIIVIVLAVLGLGAFAVVKRRGSADERE